MRFIKILIIVVSLIVILIPVYVASQNADAQTILIDNPFKLENLPNESLVALYSLDNGIDIEKSLSVVKCESEFDETAQNPVSSASGLWQFIDGTFLWVSEKRGVDYSLEDKLDPIKSTENAMWLIENVGWDQWECN